MEWVVQWFSKPKLRNPVLVEGLPGIGNVAKLAADFIIEQLKAEKCCSFFSNSLPNSVFINEKNLVELPCIDIYYKRLPNQKRDVIILSGDVQPADEQSCYLFSQ